MVRVCFVCLGNICRSPTAEAVMNHLLEAEGLRQLVKTDSAGTSAYHVGESPDPRSTAAAAGRGIHMVGGSRQFVARDFERFDYVLAMDVSNYRSLLSLAGSDESRERVRLFRSFDAASPEGAEVPDPYYGGDRGFETVLDICDAACRGLLEHFRNEHGL